MQRLFLIYTIIFALPVFSQNSRLKLADKYYESLSYYEAANTYEDVLERKEDSLGVAHKLADCYDKCGNYKKSYEWYNYLSNHDSLTKSELIRFSLLQRRNGYYDESAKTMNLYQSKYGSNDLVENFSNIDGLDKLLIENPNFELRSQGINTLSSEIGVSYISDKEVLISSSKRSKVISQRTHNWTDGYFYDVYQSDLDGSGNLERLKSLKGKIGTKYHDGPAVYDRNGEFVYFTRNNYLKGKSNKDSKEVVRLNLYRAKLEGKKFKDVERLWFNSDEFSCAHPTVSSDGKRLYFSSDKPGGFGGMDLYVVNLDGVSTPMNLGNVVNTSTNEVFPHYNSSEDLLFFSSEGHKGIGGLDVFVAYLDKGEIVKSIDNLGKGINSSDDDFSFVSKEDQSMGYFSSNRIGGKGDDDIYAFNQKDPIVNGAILNGDVTDILTSSKLEGAIVYLLLNNGVVLDSTLTDSQGNFKFSIKGINEDFQVSAYKMDYKEDINAVKFESEKKEYNERLELMPKLDYHYIGMVTDKESGQPLDGVKLTLVDKIKNSEFEQLKTIAGEFETGLLPYSYGDNVTYMFKLEKEGYITKTFDRLDLLSKESQIRVDNDLTMTKIIVGKTDLNDVIDINPIYFDLNSSVIRPDAALELDKIVKVMKENPGMVIELGSHTDSRASHKYNEWLSDRRAKSSAQYIISKGISKDRITGKGYGENRLKVKDAVIEKAPSEEEKERLHQLNRRTEFIIVRMK